MTKIAGATPKRSRQQKRASMMSVYPEPDTMRVIGHCCTTYNAAVNCWAALQEEAMRQLAETFSPEEWAVIGEAVSAFAFDPGVKNTGAVLGEILDAPAWKQRLPARRGKSVAERLRELDYVAAWTVIILCRWHERFGGANWWSLEARGATP